MDNSLSLAVQGRVQQATNTSIPLKADALFWLDGTISGNTFVDKSGNGRNFTIAGKDFVTNWVKGFAYKSAATISAPSGDAALIAADINNYLYASNGIPNQIPVVSLFQDVDYAHKLFCRHSAQILNSNGVEIYEPRVLDIVLYNSVKSSTDLITCQSYFGVPTEVTANVRWVDPVNGLNTNAGTKAAPWQTLTKITASATNGDTIYVKTGICDLNYTWDNSTKIVTIKCIGRNITTSISNVRTSLLYADKSIYEGFNFVKGAITTYIAILLVNPSSTTFNKCIFNGGQNLILANTVGSSITVNNCIFMNHTQSAITSQLNAIVNTCHVNNIARICIIAMVGDTTINVINSNITSSDIIKGNVGTPHLGNNVIRGNNINVVSILNSSWIEGSVIDSNTGICTQVINAVDCGAVYITNNIFSIGRILTLSDTTPIVSDITVNNNTLTNISGSETPIVTIINKNLICNYNVLSCNYTTGTQLINHTSTGDNLTTEIIGNVIKSGNNGSSIVTIGDRLFIITNKITGTIKNNAVYGIKIYNPEATNTHGVAVWANKGVEIAYNRIAGWGLSIVLKGGNCDYATNLIHHNLCIDGTIVVKGVSNTPIFNNTIVCTTKSLTLLNCLADESSNEAIGTIIKNNILINSFADNNLPLIWLENSSTATIDNNVFYSVLGNPFTVGGSGATLTWVEWTALGYDVDSMLLTVGQLATMFTSIASNDFILPVGSPAIDIGETLDAVYDDGLDSDTNWGNDSLLPIVVTKQQGGTWDVGAYIH